MNLLSLPRQGAKEAAAATRPEAHIVNRPVCAPDAFLMASLETGSMEIPASPKMRDSLRRISSSTPAPLRALPAPFALPTFLNYGGCLASPARHTLETMLVYCQELESSM
jgi:hypothetical protein